jgi:hypothetical protein
MPESGPFGSVRGVCSDAHPYRDMDRRRFLGTLTLARLFRASQLSVAQPVTKVWRIVFLHAGSAVAMVMN